MVYYSFQGLKTLQLARRPYSLGRSWKLSIREAAHQKSKLLGEESLCQIGWHVRSGDLNDVHSRSVGNRRG
jgi:hypothetical protein